jgi:alpha-L-fucosidase
MIFIKTKFFRNNLLIVYRIIDKLCLNVNSLNSFKINFRIFCLILFFTKTKTMPELHELVNAYHPDIVWSDGDWAGDDNYWRSKEFRAWLYNESPVKSTVVTNDRWGGASNCKYGDFLSCSDRYNPKTLQKHKWENAFTLDKGSWGLRREAQVGDYLSIHEVIQTIAETVRY